MTALQIISKQTKFNVGDLILETDKRPSSLRAQMPRNLMGICTNARGYLIGRTRIALVIKKSKDQILINWFPNGGEPYWTTGVFRCVSWEYLHVSVRVKQL